MKKLLLLFFTLSFLSCTDNVKSPEPNPDVNLIIGKWFFFKVNGFEDSDCGKKSSFNFYDDNTLKLELYFQEVFESTPCIKFSVTEGTWKQKEDGTYNILIGNNPEVLGAKFSNNNKTLSLINSDNIEVFVLQQE